MFSCLEWEKQIRSLRDPHVPFNPLSEHDIGVENRCSDDYKLIPFSESTQAWRWRVQEEQKRFAKNDRRRADVLEKDATRGMNGEANHAVDLNENKSIDMEKGGQGGRRIF